MQLPIIGFREWVVDPRGELKSTIRGELWGGDTLRASCPAGHPEPAADCGCGLYALEAWPRFGDHRLYEHAGAPLRLIARALLTGTALAASGLLVALVAPLVRHGSWAPALVLAGSFLVGIGAVVAADVAIGRLATPYLLGAVLLTGRVLRHQNGVLRAERARIACLIRPAGVPGGLAEELAARLGVPLFGWRERARAMAYLSEHGDAWGRRG
jgi:hypothetical protein